VSTRAWSRFRRSQCRIRGIGGLGYDLGAPVDFYTKKEAEEAIENAEAIVEFCRRQIDR
jgi:HEPN domain-containing protein